MRDVIAARFRHRRAPPRAQVVSPSASQTTRDLLKAMPNLACSGFHALTQPARPRRVTPAALHELRRRASVTRATVAPRLPPARVGECIARLPLPPSPRHAGCIAREKECARARRQSARRGFPPGTLRDHRERVTSTRPTLPIARAAHVGPPKTRLWPTPARAFVARALPRALVSRLGTNRCESRVAAGAAKPSLGRTSIIAAPGFHRPPVRLHALRRWHALRGCTFPPRRGRCAGGAHTRTPSLAAAARSSQRAASRRAAPRLPPTPAA